MPARRRRRWRATPRRWWLPLPPDTLSSRQHRRDAPTPLIPSRGWRRRGQPRLPRRVPHSSRSLKRNNKNTTLPTQVFFFFAKKKSVACFFFFFFVPSQKTTRATDASDSRALFRFCWERGWRVVCTCTARTFKKRCVCVVVVTKKCVCACEQKCRWREGGRHVLFFWPKKKRKKKVGAWRELAANTIACLIQSAARQPSSHPAEVEVRSASLMGREPFFAPKSFLSGEKKSQEVKSSRARSCYSISEAPRHLPRRHEREEPPPSVHMQRDTMMGRNDNNARGYPSHRDNTDTNVNHRSLRLEEK